MNRSKICRLSVLAILAILAFSTRIFPLSISAWPFNNDGITECSIATDILDSQDTSYPIGRFYEGSYSVITPAYNLVLAFLSSAMGLSPFEIAQIVVAAVSVLAVICGYIIALKLSSNVKGGIAAALTLSLLGTFVFLTGSSWKGSLGVALLIFLVFVYMNRSDKRMLALEIVILFTLPTVHHLVAGIAFLMIWFLSIWSLAFAITNDGIRRRHVIDITTISILSICAFAYYGLTSHDRLSLIAGNYSLVVMSLVSVGLGLAAFAWLRKKNRYPRYSLAPFVTITVFALALVDYLNPIFPYVRGSPPWVLLLAGATSVVIGIGWFGLEVIVNQGSKYRAVPIGLLVPVLAILAFSLLAETGIMSHWMIYRTFDFAMISIALGVATAVAYFHAKPRAERILVICLLSVLIISFPFAYFTGPLEGVRHDTQDYEVDATTWVSNHVGIQVLLQTDERLAYNARALYDFMKSPNLPSTLVNREIPVPVDYNLLLEEWFSVGVNDYPNGHPIIDESYGRQVIDASDVFYIGGPSENSAILFSTSAFGIDEIFG